MKKILFILLLNSCLPTLEHSSECDYISKNNICLEKNNFDIDNEDFESSMNIIHSIILNQEYPYTRYWLKQLYQKYLIKIKFVNQIKTDGDHYVNGIFDNTNYPNITIFVLFKENCPIANTSLVHELLHLYLYDAEQLPFKKGWIHQKSNTPPYLLEWTIQDKLKEEVCK